MSAFFGWCAGLRFRFVRAGNAFWSLLLHLAAQVHPPGVGDVASTWTSRAASAVGRFGNAFWSLLLQLATQVRVPGAGDAALTWTSRAALRWGAFPLHKTALSHLSDSTCKPGLHWRTVSEEIGHLQIL